MSQTPTSNPPKWKSAPLYMVLCDLFPDHRTPFNRLDVPRLANDVEKNYESLYRWLRESRLNVEWAKLFCDLANDQERLIESARINAEKNARKAEFFEAYDAATQRDLIDKAVGKAVEAVRERFADNQRRLPTLEQDFLRFII